MAVDQEDPKVEIQRSGKGAASPMTIIAPIAAVWLSFFDEFPHRIKKE